eukprot:Tbor_TRINITY_DN3338_c0_g1::TRINITY_DN3338_c0_g1_i1::g.23436::m.23436
MLHRTRAALPSNNQNFRRRLKPHSHSYKELDLNRRKNDFSVTVKDSQSPRRAKPRPHRFNPEAVTNVRGTSKFAWQWWFTKYPFLPNVPPEGYIAPSPMGKIPNSAWDDDFTTAVTSLTDDALRKQILDRITVVIFEESKRDGYELRKLDFEGKPLEDLPDRRIIEAFVFEEETFRDRVIEQVVETDFRLVPTSDERIELRTTENVINFITSHVIAAKKIPSFTITNAVRDILSSQPEQPSLGFQHALPVDNRTKLVIEWEKLYHESWQFGNAVYIPSSEENGSKSGRTWLNEERISAEKSQFEAAVKSGDVLNEHRAKIALAAESV